MRFYNIAAVLSSVLAKPLDLINDCGVSYKTGYETTLNETITNA